MEVRNSGQIDVRDFEAKFGNPTSSRSCKAQGNALNLGGLNQCDGIHCSTLRSRVLDT